MRTAIVLLAGIVAASAQQDTNLTVRVQVEVLATTQLVAASFNSSIRAAILPADRSDPDNKTSESEVRTDEGRVRVIATYILADYTRATNLVSQLTATANPALSGRIHVHFCPREGSIKDWSGCDADRRARVHEIRL